MESTTVGVSRDRLLRERAEALATPAFRDPKSGRPLRVSANKWVKHLMRSIGEDPDEYGSHSARIGGATAMYKAGASAMDIQTAGRWASDVYNLNHDLHPRRPRALGEDDSAAGVHSVCARRGV